MVNPTPIELVTDGISAAEAKKIAEELKAFINDGEPLSASWKSNGGHT